LFPGLLYIPSLQIKARRGHLWRVTSAEGEGLAPFHTLPHRTDSQSLKQHNDPGVQLYENACGYDYVLIKVFT